MRRNKLSKSVLLSTLVFGQCAGTVVAMQNSIVQVYAEQKNKEVTSQEFLDYINQLKEQNPNFKFNQGETKVFDSEEQALANLAEQKERVNKVSNSVNELIAIMKDYLAGVKNKSYIVNYSFSPEKFVKKEEPSEKPNEEKPSEEETPKQEEKKEETKPEEKKQEEKKEEKKEVNSSKKENIPTGVESYFLTYVGLALVSGAGVYKLTEE